VVYGLSPAMVSMEFSKMDEWRAFDLDGDAPVWRNDDPAADDEAA
jgi:hypothetical protein